MPKNNHEIAQRYMELQVIYQDYLRIPVTYCLFRHHS